VALELAVEADSLVVGLDRELADRFPIALSLSKGHPAIRMTRSPSWRATSPMSTDVEM
jgi:hypothetical protein